MKLELNEKQLSAIISTYVRTLNPALGKSDVIINFQPRRKGKGLLTIVQTSDIMPAVLDAARKNPDVQQQVKDLSLDNLEDGPDSRMAEEEEYFHTTQSEEAQVPQKEKASEDDDLSDDFKSIFS